MECMKCGNTLADETGYCPICFMDAIRNGSPVITDIGQDIEAYEFNGPIVTDIEKDYDDWTTKFYYSN